jgi:hypothetical protein
MPERPIEPQVEVVAQEVELGLEPLPVAQAPGRQVGSRLGPR